ncbi:PASTA domain-containing protein [Kitasatospora sp. NPDC094028]
MLLDTPSPSSPSSPSTGPASPSVLSWGATLTALIVIGVVILVIGLILWFNSGARSAKSAKESTGPAGVPGGDSVARSWIALALIAGLLISVVLAFAVNDTTVRSSLIGALGAAVGAATAFFFSSKSTDQAHALLTTSVGVESVPGLIGRDADDAMRVLSTTTLKLVKDPLSPDPDTNLRIRSQDPPPGTTTPKGSTVMVTYG